MNWAEKMAGVMSRIEPPKSWVTWEAIAEELSVGPKRTRELMKQYREENPDKDGKTFARCHTGSSVTFFYDWKKIKKEAGL